MAQVGFCPGSPGDWRCPDRAGALDHELAALQQQHHRLRGVVLARPRRCRRASASSSAQRELAGALDRDAVGDRQRRRRRTGSPRAQRRRDTARRRRPGRRSTSTSGRAALIAIATPAHSPPPPTGHDDPREVRARPRAARARASPGRRRSSGRRTGARTPARRSRPARARPRCTRRRCRRRRGRSRPSPRAASTLAIGASAGTKTSQRHAAARAAPRPAPGRGCRRWPATTPLRAAPSPSAASFADAPRTLNEPVRWRFSAFSTTVPPARSENVRVDSTGVRRAIGARRRRAADVGRRTSRAVTLSQSGSATHGVDLDLGAQRQRGDADRRARRRVGLEVRAVDLVDLGERAMSVT